jgi:signal transduction histidine kinase
MTTELDRLKGAFLAIISHELRTPLTEIIAALCLLQEDYVGPLNAQQRQYLNIACGAADHLDTLIGDLIAFTQLQAEAVAIRREPASLGMLARHVITQLTSRAAAKSLRLSIDTKPDLPPILVDGGMITRVISNLVINAINYTPPGGQVSVTVGAEPGFQTIDVKDTGIGIPKEKQPLLFESFYQADNHMTRQVGGLGIGLAYARRIVEAHQGKITFTSEAGQGSTFTVRLPTS